MIDDQLSRENRFRQAVGDWGTLMALDVVSGNPWEKLVDDDDRLLYCDHQFDRHFVISLS
jgi:hypothetical protein